MNKTFERLKTFASLNVKDSEDCNISTKISTAKGVSADTWEKMTDSQRARYIKTHPTSKYAIQQKRKSFNSMMTYDDSKNICDSIKKHNKELENKLLKNPNNKKAKLELENNKGYLAAHKEFQKENMPFIEKLKNNIKNVSVEDKSKLMGYVRRLEKARQSYKDKNYDVADKLTDKAGNYFMDNLSWTSHTDKKIQNIIDTINKEYVDVVGG